METNCTNQPLNEGLFHISEQPGIKTFLPRPSPSHYNAIRGDVVFAITNQLLHNYLLPRECPRVTYYATENTTGADREKFIGSTMAKYVVLVENDWYLPIKNTTLYCYQFHPGHFILLDICAGYYVSYQAVSPIAEVIVPDTLQELLKRNVELRFTPSLRQIADDVSRSTLNYSLIRMRNAK